MEYIFYSLCESVSAWDQLPTDLTMKPPSPLCISGKARRCPVGNIQAQGREGDPLPSEKP